MDFTLSDEQVAIFDLAKSFGEENIAPHALEWEENQNIPKALWRDIASLGFGGLYVSEENGGSGLSRLDATLVFEALSMACPSVAAFLSIHNMCASMIDRYGSKNLIERVLPDALNMKNVISYCLTEPASGSDASALKTNAKKTNEYYNINGTKSFISGGGYSDSYLVMCRTGNLGPKGISTIYIEDGTEGLSFGSLEQKMGWRSQPTRQVHMDACKVPLSNLVGEEGHGFNYAMAGLDGGRLNIAACSLGAAQHALNETLTYMEEREAFGKKINQFQALQFNIADIEIELQASRILLRQAAWKLDQKKSDATHFCAIAKKFVTEAGSRITNQCLQLHGGYGYLTEYGIEKLVRDLRVHEILEGTNEIMRLIISRNLIKT